jgi:hypothetical protein
VCSAAQVCQSVSGSGGFEAVHLAKEGIELFACGGAVSGGGAQFCDGGLYLFKLVFEV